MRWAGPAVVRRAMSLRERARGGSLAISFRGDRQFNRGWRAAFDFDLLHARNIGDPSGLAFRRRLRRDPIAAGVQAIESELAFRVGECEARIAIHDRDT